MAQEVEMRAENFLIGMVFIGLVSTALFVLMGGINEKGQNLTLTAQENKTFQNYMNLSRTTVKDLNSSVDDLTPEVNPEGQDFLGSFLSQGFTGLKTIFVDAFDNFGLVAETASQNTAFLGPGAAYIKIAGFSIIIILILMGLIYTITKVKQ